MRKVLDFESKVLELTSQAVERERKVLDFAPQRLERERKAQAFAFLLVEFETKVVEREATVGERTKKAFCLTTASK